MDGQPCRPNRRPAIAHLSEKQGETWKHLEPRAGMEAVELAAGSGATASDTILDERHGMRLAPQVQGWCSWCCHWHYHQLVEECLLTRDVYKCQGCLRRTLACRRACGAFARGFDVWDEERCAACEGRVCAWSEGCLITRLHSQGHCSWCKQDSIHFNHVLPVFGPQLHECSSCGHITQRCIRCPHFAKAESGHFSPLCAQCCRDVVQWPEKLPPTRRVRSLHCSKCLTLQIHQPCTSIPEGANKAVFVCSGCSSLAHVCDYCGRGSVTPDMIISLQELNLMEPPSPQVLPEACVLCCFVVKINNHTLRNMHKRQAARVPAAKAPHREYALPFAPSFSSLSSSSTRCCPLPPRAVPTALVVSSDSSRHAADGSNIELCDGSNIELRPPVTWEELSAAMKHGCSALTVGMSLPPHLAGPTLLNNLHTMVRAPHNSPVKDKQRSKWMASASQNAAAMLPSLSSLLDDGRARELSPLSSTFFHDPNADTNNLVHLLRQCSPVPFTAQGCSPLAKSSPAVPHGEFSLLTRVIFCDALPPSVLQAAQPLFRESLAGASVPEFIACLGAALRRSSTPTRFYFIVYFSAGTDHAMDNIATSHGPVVAVACYWITTAFDMARYSGMRFLSGLWVLGFNPLSLDLAFIQIPFLEQPGICFSSDCGEGTQIAIIRDVHDVILCTHNPRVIATIQQSGGCPSRTFSSMEYGFAPYLPDTVLDLQPFSSFAQYQEMQPRPARIVMRQRQRDFSTSKCCIQQWLWDDMDSDMRLRVAYMCLCVAELHAVSGSPDLFQLTPELIHVISTLPNLQPAQGFKRNNSASSSAAAPVSCSENKNAASRTPPASTTCSANAAEMTESVVYTSNKQRKKAAQQAKMEAWARAHADNKEAVDFLSRAQKAHVQQHAPASPPQPTVLPVLSTYEARCSAHSPCKWIVARRDGGDAKGIQGELVGAMLLVYSGDTAFGLFTGLDYEASKECRAYFNLLYAMIDDVIAHEGVRFLRCGATTYYTKRRMGCQLEPVDLHYYVRGMPNALHSVVSAVLTDAVIEAANFDG